MSENWRKLLTPEKSLNLTDIRDEGDVQQPLSFKRDSFLSSELPVQMTLRDIGASQGPGV